MYYQNVKTIKLYFSLHNSNVKRVLPWSVPSKLYLHLIIIGKIIRVTEHGVLAFRIDFTISVPHTQELLVQLQC